MPGVPAAGPRPAAPYPGAPAPAPQARPAAPVQPARPAASAVQPAPAARKDPFGFGTPAAPVVAAPAAPRADDDWSDVDMGDPAVAPALADPLGRAAAPRAPTPIELPAAEVAAPELAPVHEFVPSPSATGHAPAAAAAPVAAEGGEAALRDALSKASREVIERVVWEVVPELAETIIRENLDRLVKSRQG
ncbi:MAG TPA: hypothetical protein VLC54_18220 [Anaeromyxobacter sp.]|nr:hypothetical protein [Anaeromyxobacter sp.]